MIKKINNIFESFFYKRKLKMLKKERLKFISSTSVFFEKDLSKEGVDFLVYIDDKGYWGYTTFMDAKFDPEVSKSCQHKMQKASKLEIAKLDYFNKMITETKSIINQLN